MIRLPVTLSAMALVLSLAACGGGGGGSIASTPLNNGSGSDAGEDTNAGSNTNNGGNQGSDADKDGDVLIPDSDVPGTNAVAALTKKLVADENLNGWYFNNTLDKNAIKLDVSDEGAILFVSNDETGTELLSITQDDVTVSEKGISTFAKGDGLSGKLNVVGEELDYSVFGYWVQKTDDNVFEDAGTIWGGLKTAADNMPTDGTATYVGKAVAVEYDSGALNELTGVLTATANFDPKSMSFNAKMDMKTADDSDWGQIRTAKDLDITGRGFQGGFVSNQGHTSGYGKGQFNGPGAAEVVGQFGLESNGMTNVRGAFGGKKQ